MIKKSIVALLFLNIFLFANPYVTASSPSANGEINGAINVYIDDLTIGEKDWIAVYPKSASNAWANVIDWKWVKQLPDKSKSARYRQYSDAFQIKRDGKYQVRYFEHNSFTTYKAFDFTIKTTLSNLNLKSIKGIYADEKINFVVYLKEIEKELDNGPKDWVGLYRKGDSNAWANVLTWAWVKDFKNKHFAGRELKKDIILDDGEYEVRYFKNNTFKTYKHSSFSVNKSEDVAPSRIEYLEQENQNFIKITGQGNNVFVKPKDWIGIYEANDNNDWANVIEWIWAKDTSFDSKQELGNPYRLFKLKKHYISTKKYEARYFQNNSFITYKSSTFSVK